MKVDIKKKIVEGFEMILEDVKKLSWVSLSSFLISCILLLLFSDVYREAVLEGLVFVGASLILLKLFIVKG